MTTTQTLTSDPYYSQSDAAEVARLQGLAAGGGLGQAIYDEDSELEEVIGEMGLR